MCDQRKGEGCFGHGKPHIRLGIYDKKVVATVVNSDDVEGIVNRMKKSLGGQSGAVVVISPVDDLVRV